MKKWIQKLIVRLTVICSVIGAASFPARSFQVVEGEGYKFVKISLKDTNRIICPVGIGQVIFSKEKSIQVKIVENNAFVKIIPHQKINPETGQPEIVYPSFPREMYIECGNKVFSLILTPEDIPAETIVLRLPAYEKEKASAYEKASPYKKTLLELVKAAYSEQPPQGYEVKQINRQIKNFDKVDLYLRMIMTGAHYRVSEYLIKAKERVRLSEIEFLHVERNPLAISLTKQVVTPGQTARLFIVSRTTGE